MPPRAVCKIRPSGVMPYSLMRARSSSAEVHRDRDGAGLMGRAMLQVAHTSCGNPLVTPSQRRSRPIFSGYYLVRDVTLRALRSHYFMTAGRAKRLRGREEGPMRMHVMGTWGHQRGLSRTVPEFGRVFCPLVSR